MKPPFLLLSFISSFAALVALPLCPELAITPVVITGLLVVMNTDYGRRLTPLTEPAAARKTAERLRLAA
jgi:hypothetical protein